VLSQRQLMELSCDSLINRYLVVALQNAVFSTEFLSICKAVSIFTSVQSRTVTFSHCFFVCLPIGSCKTFWMNFCEFIEQETVSLILEMYLSEAVDPLCHTYFLCASAFLFSSLSTSSLHWWLDWTVTSSCYRTESLLSYSKGWLTVAYCLDMLGVRLQTKRSWVLLLVDTQDNDPGAPVIKRCSSIPLNGQCCAAGEVVIDLMLYMPWNTD